MKIIELSNGLFTMIDDADFELVSSLKWYFNSQGYAVRRHEGSLQYMHRALLGLVLGDGIQVDHIDRDGLNNRRENLRICTHAQNMQNKGKNAKNKSGFKGVCHNKGRPINKPWRAKIKLNNKDHHLGYFNTKEQAALAYDDAARKLHGDFALLNFEVKHD